jgi:glyoxylate/hydroxypyruvate reductase A
MHILFHSPDEDEKAWKEELESVFPGAQMRVWQPGDNGPADYALVWVPPKEMLAHRTDIKAIFNLGAGVDAILRYRDALPPGVPLIRISDAGMGIQMAEYATHAVLRYFRRFDEYETQARAGIWNELKPHVREEFPIGILGLGVLGQRIIKALQHFEFPINGWSRTPKEIPGVRCYSGKDGLDEFLSKSRVLICVLPLTPETTGILNERTLSKLPQGSYVINIARGPELIEEDLLHLLDKRHIMAATLDVFQQEPHPKGSRLWGHPRITKTPHIAALTMRSQTIRQIAEKMQAMERGEPVEGLVDFDKGY